MVTHFMHVIVGKSGKKKSFTVLHSITRIYDEVFMFQS